LIDKQVYEHLKVPVERLARRDPLRNWTAELPVEKVWDEGKVPEIADVRIAKDSVVAAELVLSQVREGVLVSGTLSVPWVGECSRCLFPVDGLAEAFVQELFELNPKEGESYLLGEEIADLTPMARDSLLLELPIAAVPCPFQEPCENYPQELIDSGIALKFLEKERAETGSVSDPRWAALGNLIFDDDEDTDLESQ
jgi:uncharacterized protein|tara:strand:- start:1643 stop:2233 length:591 start_codon:yes stop_codon:yes gene_type:complete